MTKLVKQPNVRELIAFCAILIATVALSVDIMLPGLNDIASEFGVLEDNRRQWVVSSLFIGLSLGQLTLGTMTDRYGRRPIIFLGTGLFIIGSFVAVFASTFEMLLMGRIIQGFGAAGPRIGTVALVRDQYRGPTMARIMSFIMGTFILVPVLAPSIGQLLLFYTDWRGLFIFVALFCLFGTVWLYLRQPETHLKREKTQFKNLLSDAKMILTSITPMAYTLCAACCFGSMLGFLISSQQLFQDLYLVGNRYALLLALSSISVGAASFVNGALVKRFSMEGICIAAISCLILGSLMFRIYVHFDNVPPLHIWMLFNCAALFVLGLTFGNFNAISLQDLGHVAGFASAIYATITAGLSMALASLVGMQFDMTVTPIVSGYIIYGCIGLFLMLLDRRYRLKHQTWPTSHSG